MTRLERKLVSRISSGKLGGIEMGKRLNGFMNCINNGKTDNSSRDYLFPF
jgi:hypothetical protein